MRWLVCVIACLAIVSTADSARAANGISITNVTVPAGNKVNCSGTYTTDPGWVCMRIEITILTFVPTQGYTPNGGSAWYNPVTPWTSPNMTYGVSGNSMIQAKAYFRDTISGNNTSATTYSTGFFLP